MSMCKTGCGTQTGNLLCHACNEAWKNSAEYMRAAMQNPGLSPVLAGFRALMDFCTRTRAERLNGGRA